jgi:hypothetical protein
MKGDSYLEHPHSGWPVQVCDSVGRGLEGQRLAGFTGLAAFVRKAFEDSLSGILNKRAVDVLLEIKKAQVGCAASIQAVGVFPIMGGLSLVGPAERSCSFGLCFGGGLAPAPGPRHTATSRVRNCHACVRACAGPPRGRLAASRT